MDILDLVICDHIQNGFRIPENALKDIIYISFMALSDLKYYLKMASGGHLG